uniref:Uncharacterized protein n=1 Tax=Bartonella schoenbuchensis TaxID=165694 RepID=A0A024LQF0_9HYPH|nr:hypothetical protein BN1046_00332 [Bartonella schoenbuchensis]
MTASHFNKSFQARQAGRFADRGDVDEGLIGGVQGA